MAELQNVQKNIATEMQILAEQILVIKNRLAIIGKMYATENMAQLADADLQALPEFAHVTVAELNQASNALEAINVAMGEYVAGTNTTKLMKIVPVVPK